MAAQKEAAWSDVAKRMAHEINNPLTPIQLSAERIKKKLTKGASKEDALFIDASTKTIIRQVEVLRELVSAFSNFADRELLHFKTVNINYLIDESIQLFAKQYKNISIQLKAEKIDSIEADPNKIQQVLNNLLLNSIDACENLESPQIIFETRLKKMNSINYCVLSLTDNGEGFSEDMIENAFEPYQTSKPQGKGLGLAIVKSIIDEHKGNITIENSDNGALIRISLPVIQDKQKENTG
jgi:nitrogen fixation/metabolism regulation signal transduction histidine kinase